MACEYCTSTDDIYLTTHYIGDDFIGGLFMRDGKLFLETEDESEVSANYCPKCGEKLGGAE